MYNNLSILILSSVFKLSFPSNISNPYSNHYYIIPIDYISNTYSGVNELNNFSTLTNISILFALCYLSIVVNKSTKWYLQNKIIKSTNESTNYGWRFIDNNVV